MRRAKFWLALDVVFAVMNACCVAVGNDSIIMCCNAVIAIILSLQAIAGTVAK